MAGAIRYQIILGNKVSESGSVSYTEYTMQEFVVANGSSDSSVSFGGVTTADIVYLKSDQALTVNINSSSGTNITLDANKPLISVGTAVTAMYLSNASGTDANVLFKIWGA
jgi:hypothetical protein